MEFVIAVVKTLNNVLTVETSIMRNQMDIYATNVETLVTQN
jgi:hypothetical protein